MTYEAFVSKDFRKPTLAIIAQANTIVSDYTKAGFQLTLRQLYYQFVRRNWIPNTQRSYDRLGAIISDARLAGLLSWDAIEDRTRNLKSLAHWDHPRDILSACAKQYRSDRWANQQHYVEVWIEKEALAGVIEPVCNDLDVPFFACRGYVSQSEQWRAGKRLAYRINAGQEPVIIHLGDHDPSGIDMTRDNEQRLWMFSEGHVLVRRIALTRDQVDEYSLPPNPAKMTDSRFGSYADEHGNESWELDALDPKVIQELITAEVEAYRDDDQWDEDTEKMQRQRDAIQRMADIFDEQFEDEE